jgi:hypothetical protein
MIVEEGLEPKTQLFGQIVFLERLKQRDRRSERADERRAFRATREVLLEVGAHVSREAAVEIVGEQGDDAGTGGLSRK